MASLLFKTSGGSIICTPLLGRRRFAWASFAINLILSAKGPVQLMNTFALILLLFAVRLSLKMAVVNFPVASFSKLVTEE